MFKTISDQFGKYSFIKVLSGKVTSDLSLRDVRMSRTDRLGRMYTMCGKKNTEVKEACCGDIVAIGKMEWKTGDTVCDPKNEVELSLEDAQKVSKLIDNLDDLDDVQNIYSNWTASDEVMAQLDEE